MTLYFIYEKHIIYNLSIEHAFYIISNKKIDTFFLSQHLKIGELWTVNSETGVFLSYQNILVHFSCNLGIILSKACMFDQ